LHWSQKRWHGISDNLRPSKPVSGRGAGARRAGRGRGLPRPKRVKALRAMVRTRTPRRARPPPPPPTTARRATSAAPTTAATDSDGPRGVGRLRTMEERRVTQSEPTTAKCMMHTRPRVTNRSGVSQGMAGVKERRTEGPGGTQRGPEDGDATRWDAHMIGHQHQYQHRRQKTHPSCILKNVSELLREWWRHTATDFSRRAGLSARNPCVHTGGLISDDNPLPPPQQ